MYFNGPYLRVFTPKTTNGVIPLIIEGVPQYKESFLPISAKKQLEKKNARLTKHGNGHLASIIEIVGEEVKKANPRPAAKTVVPSPETETGEVPEEVPADRPKKPNPKPSKAKTE